MRITTTATATTTTATDTSGTSTTMTATDTATTLTTRKELGGGLLLGFDGMGKEIGRLGQTRSDLTADIREVLLSYRVTLTTSWEEAGQIRAQIEGTAKALAKLERDIQLEQQGQSDAKKGGMRERVTKIGKPAPDDKTAKRPGHQRNANSADNGSCKEIVKHLYLPCG